MAHRRVPSSEEPNPTFSVLLPYYNEQDYLGRTLESLWAQELRPNQIILVNNASTDQSPAVAKTFAADHPDLDVVLLDEPTPGKVHALKTGLSLVKHDWCATCDADTFYPRHYFATARRMIESTQADTVALMAIGVAEPADLHAASRSTSVLLNRLRLAERFPGKCFTGGYGQVFKTEVLRKVGGFDANIWPYVLMDHEVVHRVHTIGKSLYDAGFWCVPSARRATRSNLRWNLFERKVYRHTPCQFEPWFFYRFLANRFKRRGLSHLNLRQQTWNGFTGTVQP